MASSFKSYVQADVSTGSSTVYTVPASTETVIIGLFVSNKSVSPVTVDVQVSGVYIVKGKSIAVADTLNVLNGNKLSMEATETVVVTAGTATALDAHVSIVEKT